MNVKSDIVVSDPTPRIAATHKIADFVVGAKPDGLARERAAASILDAIAVMLAGGTEPDVARFASTLPAADGAQTVRNFWAGTSLSRDAAARLYGMASDALDYDDVSMLALCHPTAPVLSARLAQLADLKREAS